jgi:hypothetical protein
VPPRLVGVGARHDIEHVDVQAWVTRLSHRLAPETVASCHGLLSAILATAVRSRKVGANPCDGVRRRLGGGRLMRTALPHAVDQRLRTDATGPAVDPMATPRDKGTARAQGCQRM